MSSLSHIALTIFLSPFITLKTPSGKPDNFNNSAILDTPMGVCSEGLNTIQFPKIKAFGIVHIGTIIGKLNGAIDATIPIDS